MSLSWGGFLNGRIPFSAMKAVDNGQLLQTGAANAWLDMRDACFADTGYWITTNEGYRSLDTQQSYADQKAAGTAFVGVSVATPGTSNHGWGRANDIGGYNQPGVWNWLQANAVNYGWDWTTGRNVGETWHWEYLGALDYERRPSIPAPAEEDLNGYRENYARAIDTGRVYAIDAITGKKRYLGIYELRAIARSHDMSVDAWSAKHLEPLLQAELDTIGN